MPFLIVNTNAELKDKNTQEFLSAATDLVANELHKPKNYVIVVLNANPEIAFGGSRENKGVLAEMKSIGFGSAKNSLSKLLTEFFADRLAGIELNNINIEFVDMPAADVAIGGRLMG